MREINLRQRKFVEGKMKGKSSSQAARDAGYAESTARRADAQIANKPAVRKLLAELMEEAGLTDAKLVSKLSEGIDAKVVKLVQRDGKFTDARAFPDFKTRLDYLELGFRLKGHLTDKHEIVDKPRTLADILSGSFSDEGDPPQTPGDRST
jgi:hypothetical protein